MILEDADLAFSKVQTLFNAVVIAFGLLLMPFESLAPTYAIVGGLPKSYFGKGQTTFGHGSGLVYSIQTRAPPKPVLALGGGLRGRNMFKGVFP